jgi:hypothetical protein
MDDSTRCPECGREARVRWRAVLESTDGPVEHAKVVCRSGHWFLLPLAMLVGERDYVSEAAASRMPGSTAS